MTGNVHPKRIQNAVIPAAGKGTRMQSITGGVPKELLKINGIPLIVHTMQEAVDAGVSRIFVIISPKKPELRDYLEKHARLEINGRAAGFNELQRFDIECIFLEQAEPQGLAHAVSLTEPYITTNDFLVLLPDNYFPDKPDPAVQLIEAYTPGLSCAGILKLTPDILPNFSNTNIVTFERKTSGMVVITSLSEKQMENFPHDMRYSIYRATGRSIYSMDFFRVYHLLLHSRSGESDDIPILRRLIDDGKMIGCILKGAGFDAGNPAGFIAANDYNKE